MLLCVCACSCVCVGGTCIADTAARPGLCSVLGASLKRRGRQPALFGAAVTVRMVRLLHTTDLQGSLGAACVICHWLCGTMHHIH
jgi:hypothetical protein